MYASSAPSFPAPDQATLDAIRAGMMSAADVLIRAAEPKIKMLALRFQTATCGMDELVEAGRLAVWNALRKYAPECGPFDNYATRAVVNSLRKEAMSGSISSDLGGSEEIAETDRDPSEQWEARSASRKVRRAMRALPGAEFDVLFLIYGCDYSERRAASVLGVSQPRVNQLRKQALGRLRAALLPSLN